jgi:integrase
LARQRKDRTPERRVFPYATNSGARNAMLRACRLAGVHAFTPHDLRHRRASLWHAQGVPDRQVQERIGHERLSTTQDVYTHVVVDPTDDEWT